MAEAHPPRHGAREVRRAMRAIAATPRAPFATPRARDRKQLKQTGAPEEVEVHGVRMMRIEKTVATLPCSLPAMFQVGDASFVKADSAAEAFGIALNAGLPPDERDKQRDRRGGPPERYHRGRQPIAALRRTRKTKRRRVPMRLRRLSRAVRRRVRAPAIVEPGTYKTLIMLNLNLILNINKKFT